MRKPARFQATKNRSQKALAFFSGSARVGIAKIAALAVPVFIKPASWRVFFFYVIGFPSNSCEHRNGRTPESDGPLKKCVVRIAGQQARPGERCVPLRPSGRANQAGRLAVLGCACVCDRCGQERTSRKRRGENPPNSGRKKPPQKALAFFCRILQEWDCQITALTELQFLEGPLRRVFFFRSSGFLQLLAQEGPESRRPSPSLPDYFSHGKLNATCKCFSLLIQL